MPAFSTTTSYGPHTIAAGQAEADDKARFDNGDPKADYLAGVRIVGVAAWLCSNDPTTAANWGIACPATAHPDPGANGPGT